MYIKGSNRVKVAIKGVEDNICGGDGGVEPPSENLQSRSLHA